MSELTHLKEAFDRLRQGAYITHEHGGLHTALAEHYQAYKDYFAPLGMHLVRHPRDFFYLHTDTAEQTPPSGSLPPIAVFCFILIEATANEGRPVEEYLLTERFSVAGLPHLGSDRYKAHLKAVGVDDEVALRKVVRSMVRLGWVEYFNDDTFRFLRPFHRMFDKCQAISAGIEQGNEQGTDAPAPPPFDPELN